MNKNTGAELGQLQLERDRCRGERGGRGGERGEGGRGGRVCPDFQFALKSRKTFCDLQASDEESCAVIVRKVCVRLMLTIDDHNKFKS